MGLAAPCLLTFRVNLATSFISVGMWHATETHRKNTVLQAFSFNMIYISRKSVRQLPVFRLLNVVTHSIQVSTLHVVSETKTLCSFSYEESDSRNLLCSDGLPPAFFSGYFTGLLLNPEDEAVCSSEKSAKFCLIINFWWKNWQWGRFSPSNPVSTCQLSFHQLLHVH
jgi:hypothetical protein